jgi:hypothetical protein
MVRVTGRPGTGRATVAAALGRAGWTVLNPPGPDTGDVTVLVVAETVKPEDSAGRAALVVLNKMDLLGAAAPGQVGEIRRRTGRPTVPLNALLATAVLDDSLVGTLQVRALDQPGRASPVDAALADRLLATLDRFGIDALTDALRAGAGPSALPGLLRELSGLDEVLTALTAAAAPVRYGRIETALTELRALAVYSGDVALWDLLACDAVVLAVMSAAADVLRADGLPVGGADAVRWSRYGRGPVNALHRRCAHALTRGALRLTERA